jgi:hypothetical protein
VIYEDGKVQGVWPFKRLRGQGTATESATPMPSLFARVGILAPAVSML